MYEIQLLDIPQKAAGAITKNRFVKISAADTVAAITALTDAVLGVAKSTASAAGESVAVAVNGIAMVEASAAIAVGAEIGPSANGRAVTTTGENDDIAGVAMTAASGAGELISVLLQAKSVKPAFYVAFAAEATTGGGAAAEAITVTGVLATDLVLVTLHTVGATPRTILTSVASADTITVTFSGDPSTDHVVTYMVLRAT